MEDAAPMGVPTSVTIGIVFCGVDGVSSSLQEINKVNTAIRKIRERVVFIVVLNKQIKCLIISDK